MTSKPTGTSREIAKEAEVALEEHSSDQAGVIFAQRVTINQSTLAQSLRSHYDYIVCGSGSSGSVVAARLAADTSVSVLLLEAGGSEDHPHVSNAGMWGANLGSERDWGYKAEPNPHLNGRAIPLSMGKVLGGGSSINISIWARGHKSDWDYFGAAANDPAWNYASVLGLYREIEDWQGTPDPERRGRGGLLAVRPVENPNPIAPAMLEAAADLAIPVFDDQNGKMMEGAGGAALANVRISGAIRLSVFRSYVYPRMAQPNLTVLPHSLVTKILFKGTEAIGVEAIVAGKSVSFEASRETILSLGAIGTPKLLMQSGVGDAATLAQHGIDCIQNLPGVGQNFQDHFVLGGCVWEYKTPLEPKNSGAEATIFWKSESSLPSPDLQPFQVEFPVVSPEIAEQYGQPSASSWMFAPGVVRPHSQGRIEITGADPLTPVRIFANTLAEPQDMAAAKRCIELCRELGNRPALTQFSQREVLPGPLKGKALEDFVRNSAITYWHMSCTAKMGTDENSVVDNHLRVYGVQRLRIADSSIMPRVTTGNTMAPCVIIGEQAARFLGTGNA